MLSSSPGTRATAWPAGFQQAGVVGGAWPARRGAAPAAVAKRNACGVCARNRPARGTVSAICPSASPRFSVSATGTAGMAPGTCCQRRQQRRDGARRDERAGGVVHQHDVRRVRRQRLQPGAHAVLARGAARHRRQVRQAGQRRRRSAPRRRPAGAGRPRRARRSAAWRMHRLAGDAEELLGRLGAEAAAGAGGDKERGDAHGGRLCRRVGAVNGRRTASPRRVLLRHTRLRR